MLYTTIGFIQDRQYFPRPNTGHKRDKKECHEDLLLGMTQAIKCWISGQVLTMKPLIQNLYFQFQQTVADNVLNRYFKNEIWILV